MQNALERSFLDHWPFLGNPDRDQSQQSFPFGNAQEGFKLLFPRQGISFHPTGTVAEGLGFAIPYLHNGQMHDYVPDYIVRLKAEAPKYLILETKGYDPLEDVKRAAAERWVAAVNSDGTYGTWRYALVRRPTEVSGVLSGLVGDKK